MGAPRSAGPPPPFVGRRLPGGAASVAPGAPVGHPLRPTSFVGTPTSFLGPRTGLVTDPDSAAFRSLCTSIRPVDFVIRPAPAGPGIFPFIHCATMGRPSDL